MTRVVLVEPAARTSNEHELWRAVPDAELIVVSDREGWDADRTVIVPARRLPILGGREAWTAALAWFRGLDRLDIDQADAVVSLELFSTFSLQANRLARRLGTPHLVLVFETMADFPLYRLPPYRQITRRVMESADGFICVTERARDASVALGCDPDRCVVVHPAVDTDVFTPAASLEEQPRVLFVGMLRADRGADKGVFDLIHACERLVRRFPELRLTMVGEGHLRPDIEAGADRWPFLELLGHVPRAQIPDLMRSSRVLVLGSKRTWKWEEQFGYALVEAMASGLPVVGTRSGAIPEIVGPGNGLVEPGDVDGLADAIASALGPAGEDMGAANRKHALTCFDLPTQGEKLGAALESFRRH